jgi:hypothetical protein
MYCNIATGVLMQMLAGNVLVPVARVDGFMPVMTEPASNLPFYPATHTPHPQRANVRQKSPLFPPMLAPLGRGQVQTTYSLI